LDLAQVETDPLSLLLLLINQAGASVAHMLQAARD